MITVAIATQYSDGTVNVVVEKMLGLLPWQGACCVIRCVARDVPNNMIKDI